VASILRFHQSIVSSSEASRARHFLLATPSDLSDEKVERGLAEAEAVAVGERARLARAEPHCLVDDRPVDAPQIFQEERVALAPDARVAARDFGLRVEAREVYV